MRTKLVLAGVALLVAASSTACGDDAETSSVEGQSTTDQVEQPAAVDEAEVAAEAGLAPVEYLLPEAVAVPADYAEVLAECAEPAAAEGEYRSIYSFAVPSGWTAVARGSGGSGGMSSTDVDLEFDTGEGRVMVAMDRDRLDTDGAVLDWASKPFTSFDEEITSYSSDDSEEQVELITFEDLGTIGLPDQEVTLWRAAQEQSPESLSSTRYKARLSTVSVPQPNVDRSNAVTHSIVVTIEHNSDETPLDQAVVEQIIGSFAIAPCVREEMNGELELMLGEDVDGDGEVRDAEDVLAELEEMQEQLQQQQ